MQQVLILTVGGSHEPIVESIEHNRPDFVFFLCSDDIGSTKGSYVQVAGEGNVLKSSFDMASPDLPNIVTLTGLQTDGFEIRRIASIDELPDCYRVAAAAIRDAHTRFEHATILADYTGGTKSMTAGLVAAALDDDECALTMVTGVRKDLKKVVDRTSLVRSVQIADLQLLRRVKIAEELLTRYDYGAAREVIEEASRLCRHDESFQQLTEFATLCRGFDAWDRFDHPTAKACLAGLSKGRCGKQKAFLDVMLEKRGHGFEMVEDILLNAARRAAQHRYDDAAGRLYRATEMTAQIWLDEKYGIETGNVDLTKVPENARLSLEEDSDDKGRIRIGLIKAWDLISEMPDDSVGKKFRTFRPALLKFLSVRNESLLAHGIQPVGKSHFRLHSGAISRFIGEVIDLAIDDLKKKRKIPATQFPTEFGYTPALG
jgi:hypothetical protein